MRLELGRLGVILAVAVILLLFPTGIPVARASGHLSAPDPARAPSLGAGRAVGPRGDSSGLPFVASTISVRNGSQLPGNSTPPNALPYDVAADPVDGSVVVSSDLGDYLAVLNGSNFRLDGFVAVGAPTEPVLFVPGSSVAYVGEEGTPAQVQAINFTTDAVVQTVPTPEPVTALGWNPAADQLFVGDSDGELLAVDASNGTVTATAQGPGMIIGLAFDPSSNSLLIVAQVNADQSDPVQLFNGTTLALEATVGAGLLPNACAYDPATGEFYVADYQSANVTVLNGFTGQPTNSLAVGRGPENLAIDPNGSQLYVANALSDNITIIPVAAPNIHGVAAGGYGGALAYDALSAALAVSIVDFGVDVMNGSTGDPVASTQTGWGSGALAIDPAAQVLYSTNPFDDSMEIVNLSSNRSIDNNVVLGADPNSAVFDPSTGQLFVSDYASTNLTVYNVTLGRTTTSISIGFSPGQLALDPNNGTLFVGDAAYPAQLFQVSTRSDSVTNAVDVGCTYCPGEIDGVAYSNVTDQVYASFSGGPLYAFHAGTLQSAGSAATGPDPGELLASPYNDSIYVADPGYGNVSVLRGDSLSISGSFPTGQYPGAMALDAQDGYLFVVDEDSSNLTVIDTVDGSVLETLALAGTPYDVAYDPSTGLVYVSEWDTGAVAVIDPDTPTPTLGHVTVAPASIDQPFRATVDLQATPISDLGVPLTTGVSYEWAVSSPSLGQLLPSDAARVTFTTGTVNAAGALWANATYGGCTQSARVPVQVTGSSAPTIASVTISPSTSTVSIDASQPFAASTILTNGLTGPPSTTFRWSVSPTALGSLNSSTGSVVSFQGAAPGQGRIYVNATYQGATVTAEANVTVTASVGPVLSYVYILPTSIDLTLGGSTQFHAEAIGVGGANLTDAASFQWNLSPSSLGVLTVVGAEASFLLNATEGSGTVSVTGTVGSVSRSNQTTISVVTPSPPHPTPLGGGALYYELLAALGIVVVVVVAVLLVARRRRRGGMPSVESGTTTRNAAPPGDGPPPS
jgi:DNA-binding beta-propeller fold protein YncE